jgi:hypothetical protein
MSSYSDKTAECPAGHRFTVRRRVECAGLIVDTYCHECKTKYPILAGPQSYRSLEETQHKRGAPTRESQIETRLVQRVKAAGGEVRKVKWIGRNSAPDRLVMLPNRAMFTVEDVARWFKVPMEIVGPLPPQTGVSIWVELKPPGGAATFPKNAHERAQHREHERMRKMGQRVEVVDSYEQIEELLK